jgi:hypothetical protein
VGEVQSGVNPGSSRPADAARRFWQEAWMLAGFEKIVEERIRVAQKKGEFDNLEGRGKPLVFQDDRHVPEDLRLAYKILKNANFLPPEIELKQEIRRTEDLLAGMSDTALRYRTLKKLNFLILKLNSIRNTAIQFEEPQQYMDKLAARIENGPSPKDGKHAYSRP